MEKWVKIPNFPGYLVSDLGRVRSIKSRKVLKPIDNGKGYLSVSLSIDGVVFRRYIHRLVLISFLGIDGSRPTVNHLNGIKSDNKLKNLQWATQGENNKHCYDLKLKDVKGIKNPSSKLTEYDAMEIHAMYDNAKMKVKDIALAFSVHCHTIYSILGGKHGYL